MKRNIKTMNRNKGRRQKQRRGTRGNKKQA
jgi:hypothetical protein